MTDRCSTPQHALAVIEEVLAEMPYTQYEFRPVSAAHEKERADKHARVVAYFVAERFARSETQASEGYPGIAHDLETMRTALTNLLVQYEGVYDCVDNDGKRYQSQGAADAEVAARKALKMPLPEAPK
jgi:hypothetical protein